MTHILLTGFGPFPGASRNPSAALVAQVLKLHGKSLGRCGVKLHVAVLPVTFAGIEPVLERLFATSQPDAILHLGLAGRSRHIRVEVLARNRISLLHGDSQRQQPRSRRIGAGADTLRSPLPCAQILQKLQAARLPARMSLDAGDYVCNQTLYLSLLAGHRAGFIHIPRANPQAQRSGRLARAIASALVVMAVSLRRP